MPLEEVLTLRVEDIGHLHGGPAHGCGGFRRRRDRRNRRRRHVQLLQRIRRGMEVSLREVEIDGRVGQIGMAQQQLDRPQIGARF